MSLESTLLGTNRFIDFLLVSSVVDVYFPALKLLKIISLEESFFENS